MSPLAGGSNAYRCSVCGISWPHHKDYAKCPSCLRPSDAIGDADPMPEADARSLKAQHDFERYYEERERKRAA